jgi:hypothetical protein
MRVNWGRLLLGMLVLGVGCFALFMLASGPLGDALDSLVADESSTGSERSGGGDRASDLERAGTSEDDPRRGGSEDADRDSGGSDSVGDNASDGNVDAPPARVDTVDDAGMPVFAVLTLQYTPYMATLAHMDAGDYMERRGYNLELFDVYSPDVDLDEQGQCAALQTGAYDALATTLDATRKCGPGAEVAIPIGQSAGNDAIVVKAGVETWSDIFDHAIAFTGGSVSEYMACFASHTAGVPMQFPVALDDASDAVDAWLEAGERPVLSVVAWEPEVSRALAAQPDAEVILSSRDVRILWDVINFSTTKAEADPEAFHAFTEAYYESLRDLTRDPRAAMASIREWAEGDPDREALLTVTADEDFVADLELEAFATLRDAAILMEEELTLRNRLEEAAFYWRYCDAEVPDVQDVGELIATDFVTRVRANNDALLTEPGQRPSSMVFQVTDFTNRDAISDAEISGARQLFSVGVDIEFLPNRTDFRDPAEAQATLRDAVRFLRTCGSCYLELQGSSAFPFGAERVGFTLEIADELAVARGRRVFEELRDRFDVPEAQLQFVETPRERKFPGSNNEQDLRQDRRTYLTGYQLPGG